MPNFELQEISCIKQRSMDTKELEDLPDSEGAIETGKSQIIAELIEYELNSVVSKTIMKRSTGTVNTISFDGGEGLDEKISPFDSYVQLIDGSAVIEIDKKQTTLHTGDGILIPAHVSSRIIPNGRFKLILTVIKSALDA